MNNLILHGSVMTQAQADINILQIIKQNQSRFTPQQARIANYLLNHHDKVAFLTATQLAREIGVSQPTVIRFAQLLGFPKFHLFVEAFQRLLRAELTSADRFNLSLLSDRPAFEGSSNIILREIKTLTQFARTFPQDAFDKVVKDICQSRSVSVLGTRGSASLAQYLAYFLGKVKGNVFACTNGSTNDFDRLLQLQSGDLVVALAFPRYPRESVEMIRFCHKRNLRCIGITDKPESPLTAFCDTNLIIPITFSTIFDSYCSVLCLFNMLVTEVGKTSKEESATLFHEFEELARDIKIFYERN